MNEVEIDMKNEKFSEQAWQRTTVSSVKEDSRSFSQQVITGLLSQILERETQAKLKEQEVASLRATVTDLNSKLNAALTENKRLLENQQRYRQTEVHNAELSKKLSCHEEEIQKLTAIHKQAIVDLTTGAKATLAELENQLEAVEAKEEESRHRLAELEEINKINEKKLEDWNRVSKEMGNELSDVKNKLQSSRYANNKMREEMGLWKKYCEKVEEERKSVKRDADKESRVLKMFGEIESNLKSERIHRNVTLEAIKQIGNKLLEDLKQLRCSKESKVKMVSVESQTENTDEEQESKKKDVLLEFMRKKEMQLEDELKKCRMEFENLKQQNLTLREVVRAMKLERENSEKEKEHREEEMMVTKLEESVKMLRNNFLNEEKDVCCWSAIQDLKKEISNLKNKKMAKPVNKDVEVKKLEIPGIKYGVPKDFRK